MTMQGARNNRRQFRRGAVLAYVSVAMLAFVGFVSLAVDVGRVRVVKRQLQQAADASARYSAAGLGQGVSVARSNAVSAAADNTADGTTVVVDPNADVQFGTWDGSTFTVLTGSAQSQANAVRVTARRTAANGNAVPLFLAKIIGQSTCDVTASSVASINVPPPAGIVAYNGLTWHNNDFIGGYNSSVTTNPTQALADTNATVGTNAVLSGHTGDNIKADLLLGPGASVSGPTVWGSQRPQSVPLPLPTMPACTPQPNPGAIPAAYSASGNIVLPGGSYYFTSLSINGSLSFSGPATVYVNGNITISGSLPAYASVPGNLQVFQYGSHQLTDGGNGATTVADIIAPLCDFSTQNNLRFCGRGVFNTITCQNNSEFFFDESLATQTGGVSVSTQQ